MSKENKDYPTTDDRNNKNTDIFDRVDTVLTTVKTVKKFSWKDLTDGVFKIIFIVMGILFISFGTWGITHVDDIIKYFINKSTDIQTEQHDQRFFHRMEVTSAINAQLKNMYNECVDVDRIYIIEFHNGSSNLSDLPFCHGTMTYEFCAPGGDVIPMKDNWGNIKLENFFNEVCHDTLWCGTTDDVKCIDERFYFKLKTNNIEYLEMVALFSPSGKPIGVMGIGTGTRDVTSEQIINNKKILLKYSQAIATELSSGF